MAEWERLTLEGLGLMPGSLTDEVAVITGAARGIGREMALAFARLGAAVAVADVADEGEDVAGEITRSGGHAIFVRADVSLEPDVSHLAERAEQELGPVTLLANNAIFCPVAPLHELDIVTFDRVLAVNLRGAFLTCKTIVPGMVARQRGTVLNLVSADAMPFLSAYIASKQGLAGLSQSLAAEVGPSGVRVIAFAPGMVDTPGMSEAARELAPRLGMSYDEFMAMTMPAPAAAAAAAYLVVRLAEEYHGAVVSGYDVLERASLTSRPESGSEPHIPPHEAPARETEDRLRAAQMALDLSQKLVSILRQTDEEALRLPAFVLPLARRGFRKKAGDSVEGWLRALSDVQGHLMQVSSIGAVAVAALRSEHTQLEDSLRRLLRYYQEAPRELARFTRDHEAIRQAEQVSAERGTVINDLIAALDKVMQ